MEKLKLTNDSSLDNKILSRFFNLEEFDVVTYFKDQDSRIMSSINKNNYSIAFASCIWEKLELKDKLRALYWYQCDYLKSNNIDFEKGVLTLFSESEDFVNNYFIQQKNGERYINLEELSKTSGLDMLRVVAYQNQKLLLDKKLEGYYKNISQKYFKYNKGSFYDNATLIMALSTKEKIFNYQTKSYDKVDENLKEQILLLKNKVIQVVFNEPKLSEFKEYKSSPYMEFVNSYLFNMMPIERFAVKQACKETYSFIGSLKNIELSEKDDEAFKNLSFIYDHDSEIYSKLTQDLGVNYDNFVDIETTNIFNKLKFKENTFDYVGKDLMDARKAIIKFSYSREVK